jgi:hypothetical protein
VELRRRVNHSPRAVVFDQVSDRVATCLWPSASEPSRKVARKHTPRPFSFFGYAASSRRGGDLRIKFEQNHANSTRGSTVDMGECPALQLSRIPRGSLVHCFRSRIPVELGQAV